jgi:hypothetical protein
MIIGITGALQAGKDTVAAYLVEKHGFVRLGFADELKLEVKKRLRRTVLAIFHQSSAAWHQYVGWLQKTGTLHSEEVQLDWCLWVGKPPGIRELLQEYGTQVRRADDPDYWVKAWRKTYLRYLRDEARNVVAPDTRFPNEVDEIRRFHGKIWLVTRPGYAMGKPGAHESEQGLGVIRPDAVIANDGAIGDLYSHIVARLLRAPAGTGLAAHE